MKPLWSLSKRGWWKEETSGTIFYQNNNFLSKYSLDLFLHKDKDSSGKA